MKTVSTSKQEDRSALSHKNEVKPRNQVSAQSKPWNVIVDCYCYLTLAARQVTLSRNRM